jgi:CcmD family protein
MKNKLTLILFVMILLTTASFGQSGVEMADVMRSNGKIYVVVAVAAVVMIGILIYMIVLDRKVSQIEKKLKK